MIDNESENKNASGIQNNTKPYLNLKSKNRT
jgi:hypothetical protein